MRDFAEDPPVEQRVGDLLAERAETLAVAETATGGLVGALLTSVPGASDYLDRVVVPYDYDALRTTLAVPRETLDEHGAVSEPTTRALARAARDTADATWGLATAGVAGPGGGTEDKPVGTGFVGIAYAALWESGDSTASVSRYEFDGDRTAVRERLARRALRDLETAVRGRAD
ncbi:CinA family protein [Halosimplex litoreum]|uniref:CinA family protein n=1 Tax=Halosimplex litoreum TaxID=1198301 RepID=A0A7T3FW25_9EURY|nr:CinA family protein [Halosimplex litoreum]QPV61418.1 CinA family protein [Halosimplex litoreum]